MTGKLKGILKFLSDINITFKLYSTLIVYPPHMSTTWTTKRTLAGSAVLLCSLKKPKIIFGHLFSADTADCAVISPYVNWKWQDSGCSIYEVGVPICELRYTIGTVKV